MFIKSFVLGPFQANCYLLGDEETRTCAVIDPGADAPTVLREAEESGYEIKSILLTHGHFDHVNAVADLVKAIPGLPVYIHEADTTQEPKKSDYALFLSPVPGLVFWKEGDTVKVGNLTVTVLQTPGHTEGSVTLQVEDALFTGDTLFCMSCGRTDLEGGDKDKMDSSLRRLYELEGDYRVFPGHAHASLLSRERDRNPYMRAALKRTATEE